MDHASVAAPPGQHGVVGRESIRRRHITGKSQLPLFQLLLLVFSSLISVSGVNLCFHKLKFPKSVSIGKNYSTIVG